MQELEKKIETSYEFFYRKISGFPDWDFIPTEREKISILNFANKLKKFYAESIGSDWLFDFFSFQFNYWQGKYTRLGTSGLAKIEWLIGEAAILRWGVRPVAYKWIIRMNLFNKISISLDEFNTTLGAKYEKELNIWEEDEKKRYFNTNKGFLNCLQKTTLYISRSPNC